MPIQVPTDLIQSASEAQIRRVGSNFAESIACYLGNPITNEVKVADTDKVGLYWIHGLGSEPSSVFSAINNGLSQDKLYYGAPIYVHRGVNGYIIDRPNPEAAPIFFDGTDNRNDQTPVYIQQIMFGTIHPYAVSMQLLVIGAQYDGYDVSDIITDDFSTETVQDTSAANITIPTTNNTTKGILIQIDPATETLSYKQSSEYTATIKLRQAYRAGLLPLVDSGKRRIGYFQMTYGVTAFTYADIWSCPELITSASQAMALYENPLTSDFTIPSGYETITHGVQSENSGVIRTTLGVWWNI